MDQSLKRLNEHAKTHHSLTVRIQVLNKGERLQVKTWLGQFPGPQSVRRLVHVQVVLLGRRSVALSLRTHQDQVGKVYLAHEFGHYNFLVHFSEKCP